LCEVETDKAVVEVPSPVSGTLLAHFFEAGDDVPVMTNIAAIGEPGEPVDHLRPAEATTQPAPTAAPGGAAKATPQPAEPAPAPVTDTQAPAAVSPRARTLAAQKGIDLSALQGSGPGGRIIERDVQAALAAQPK